MIEEEKLQADGCQSGQNFSIKSLSDANSAKFGIINDARFKVNQRESIRQDEFSQKAGVKCKFSQNHSMPE